MNVRTREFGTSRERLSIRYTLPNPGEGVRPMPTKWNFEAEYIQSCNCAWGCPCNFDALPTTGSCEALVSWHIKKGTFGTTKLDGTTFAWGLWWPRAIHMGNGAGRLYLDPKAKPDQRAAIEKIVGGKEGGGVFAIFPTTFAKTFPTKTAKIDFKFKGYDSDFTVDGVGGVQSEHVRNANTAHRHRVHRRDGGRNRAADPMDNRVLLCGHDPTRLPRGSVDRRDIERLHGREVDHPRFDSVAVETVRGLETPSDHQPASDQGDVRAVPDHASPADREVVLRRCDRRDVRPGEAAVDRALHRC